MKAGRDLKEGGRYTPGGHIEYDAPDVEAAIRMASNFQSQGVYKFFRGQADSSWKVTSSFARLNEEERLKAIDEFSRFQAFARRSPELVPYLQDDDALIATAQHHQLAATTFLDFSTSTEVAGWFASNDREEATHGAIFMVDDDAEATFNAFNGPNHIVRFLFPEVANHWRMQAQRGLFLETQVNIDHVWPLDRIVFPHRDGVSSIERRHIYPDRKSALEQAIDQYRLLRQRKEDFDAFMSGIDTSKLVFIEIGADKDRELDVAPSIPPAWANGPMENWEDVDPDSAGPAISIERLRLGAEDLVALATQRRQCTDLLTLTDPGDDRLQGLIDRLWSGCRPHPYTEHQLARAVSALISTYYVLKDRDISSGRALSEAAAEIYAEPIEIAMSTSGDNSTRAFVDATRLEESLKPEMRSPDQPGLSSDRMNTVLQERWQIPWSTFDETSLVELFVDQIIPWQLVSGRNPVSFSAFLVRNLGQA